MCKNMQYTYGTTAGTNSKRGRNPEIEKNLAYRYLNGIYCSICRGDNFVDGSLHQTSIRDSAFTPAHWWLYSHFVALPLGWAAVAIYDRKVPILRGPNNSMNTGLKMTILGYLATMFTIGINEMWHFWFVEEIFAVPNHWMFNMGVVVAFMGALAYVVRVYARLVELGAETPGEDPYVAEMYKMALEGKLYSRSIP